MALAAVLVAVLVAAFFAHRFATPVTRLTEASRRLAEGDFTSRVSLDAASGSLEIQALAVQFNRMAGRLEESVEIIRRDRDRSRDFLADVSHELRTPIAAMRTFIELLQGPAGRDPEARTEFLDSSAVQLDRLDWLAQNLLELSKLDSGLVLLELRPDDVRATDRVRRSSSRWRRPSGGASRSTPTVPDRPLRIRHDAPRIGQVVSNLVGNALKFTPRGGEVHVVARREPDGGARIEVADTGVGIHPAELPQDLRPLLPRLAGQRGPQHRVRPRPRDREVDRGHAPRDDRGGEPRRAGLALHGHAAARPAPGHGPRPAAAGDTGTSGAQRPAGDHGPEGG